MKYSKGVVTNWDQKLEEVLKLDKPGRSAHKKMSSQHRQDITPLKVPEDARKAAVLILLKEVGDTWVFPLIQRPSYDGVHSGQMAFPGGKYDDTDEDLIYTALRECHEEIGITVDRADVIGTLSDLYIPPSNMHVLPVVARYKEVFDYTLDDYEVDKVVETHVDHIQNIDNHKEHIFKLKSGMDYKTPAFDVDGHTVWGATAMMLSELLMVLEKI
ncbi:NUDIX hydrolase [Flammeovirga kamogawensis]|uniref:CoA pyrophosphatase n=1 Tax=Flammeovirga kamogawensis TaxID=373891 RepID=A0ABX8H0L9_9BACT|nr:CoA pyrophosphatase [Flammeovirga kamogawensis]MBB6459453.1 8-oxo-dGTP pyrophosphatase MutT (NUDIX family) [Flammeovirga kamogawensis]QWG09006.1 CoA pyrophosphatase [Flammeovirga kamogawensis]TRX67294.1 CoA pyrophosphatase [Flammeovirga kamogawensis]